MISGRARPEGPSRSQGFQFAANWISIPNRRPSAKCSWMTSALCRPTNRSARSNPWFFRWSSTCSRKGFPATWIIGFGTPSARTPSRVPSPPARTTGSGRSRSRRHRRFALEDRFHPLGVQVDQAPAEVLGKLLEDGGSLLR